MSNPQSGFAFRATAELSQIEFIQKLIDSSYAYKCNNYIVFDWTTGSTILNSVYPNPPPIQYPILYGQMRSTLDFPLWAPYMNGRTSSWGNGNLTANVEYIRSLIKYNI